MARLPRLCLPGIPQHVIQRGNNRQVCFASDEDFSAYASWLHEYSKKYGVAIHAWVFMTNHVHLLMTPETKEGISKLMQSLGRRYVRYSKLWTPHTVYLALGKILEECSVSYQEIFKGHIDMFLLKQIRDSVNRGLALGSERFKHEI